MICYKVVEKRTRYGSNLALFRRAVATGDFKDFIDSLEGQERAYFPRYKKGAKLTAPKGSIGLLVFKDIRSATLFIGSNLMTNVIVIKVKCSGKMPTKQIIRGCGDSPERILYYPDNVTEMVEPPRGTLFFKKVEVLE